MIFGSQKCVVHGAVRHQALGVDLEGGQDHVARIVAQHRTQIGWVVMHLQIEQQSAASGDPEIFGPGPGIATGFDRPGPHAFFQVSLGVLDHLAPQHLRQVAAGLHAAQHVGDQRCEFLDFGQLPEPDGRVVGLQRLGLALADLLGDVVVARLAQALLGAEVVDHQRGAHPGRLGDPAQPDAEPVFAELLDGRVPDPGGGEVG